MTYLEEFATLSDIGANGEVVATLTFAALHKSHNMHCKVKMITAKHIDGTAPTDFDVQVWNKKDADHWTNKDLDVEESIFKVEDVGAADGLFMRKTDADFGDLKGDNKDTVANEKNRLYIGVKLNVGDATTDVKVGIGIEVKDEAD